MDDAHSFFSRCASFFMSGDADRKSRCKWPDVHNVSGRMVSICFSLDSDAVRLFVSVCGQWEPN